jgi:hypothetical protein
MKSDFLLAPSAMDFLRHQWPVPSVQKPNKHAPSAIKKSPIIRKQIESPEACKNVSKKILSNIYLPSNIDWRINYLPIVIKG